jgi:DNA processing protein
VATPAQLCEELNLISAGASSLPLSAAPVTTPKTTMPGPPPAQFPLLRWLGEAPIHVDEVARESGLPIAEVSSTLQILELQGLVKQSGPMMYCRA